MKKAIKHNINCDVKVSGIEYWKGEDFLIPKNSTYQLIIDYPFNKAGVFELKTTEPIGMMGLIKFIGKCYIKQYKNAETDDDNGYWHGIEDLVIEGININHKTKKIELFVGS